jgi:hypothetical protein
MPSMSCFPRFRMPLVVLARGSFARRRLVGITFCMDLADIIDAWLSLHS